MDLYEILSNLYLNLTCNNYSYISEIYRRKIDFENIYKIYIEYMQI